MGWSVFPGCAEAATLGCGIQPLRGKDRMVPAEAATQGWGIQPLRGKDRKRFRKVRRSGDPGLGNTTPSG